MWKSRKTFNVKSTDCRFVVSGTLIQCRMLLRGSYQTVHMIIMHYLFILYFFST